LWKQKKLIKLRRIELFESFRVRKDKSVHELSGIALIVDGKLLLVHAKKYIGQNKKWSIPKGHIEGDSLESALKELQEETGIILDKECDEMIEFKYVKGGVVKLMDVYVYWRDKSEIAQYLTGWTIKPEFYDPNEIIGAKFFDLNTTCRKKIDITMVDLIDKLEEE
jgi:8-oxo-dGTP pyrophosphatase MutT (NUDIX family)